MTPRLLRFGMNVWPPLLCSGIRITDIADDWSSATVRLSVNRITRNYVGTAFGGSLSAMTDPFFMLLLMQRLGPGYQVWDTAGTIEFVNPGRGTLTSKMEVPMSVVEQIKAETAEGNKSLTWFETEIVDAEGITVATVRRRVYARKKRVQRAVLDTSVA